jgi:ATP-dependent Clp protease ATP-binding subunit ClpA
LDEIEKAHPDIFNVLLQVMDYATLTDNQGRKADFRNVILIMTSNAGANRLGKSGIGFISENQDNGVLMDAIKQTFQPEFRNRLSKVVAFNSMDDKMAMLVVEKKLSEMANQLKEKKIIVKADKKAKELVKKRGISQEFGAREVDRVIRNDIKPLFVDEILFGKLKDGGKLTITVKDAKFAVNITEK